MDITDDGSTIVLYTIRDEGDCQAAAVSLCPFSFLHSLPITYDGYGTYMQERTVGTIRYVHGTGTAGTRCGNFAES
jgi:hypothetical protein